jgi:hypothetical protein
MRLLLVDAQVVGMIDEALKTCVATVDLVQFIAGMSTKTSSD